MNCKPGDLAIVLGSKGFMHNGKIVEVLEFVRGGESFVDPCGVFYEGIPGEPDGWLVISKHEPFEPRSPYWVFHDHRLKPIRPGDLEDETPTVRELEAA